MPLDKQVLVKVIQVLLEDQAPQDLMVFQVPQDFPDNQEMRDHQATMDQLGDQELPVQLG